MMGVILSFFSGFLFAIGLVVSGMSNPEVVTGFLDIFGNWNYSLALVMAGAVGFNLISFNILKNKKPIFSKEKYLPTKTKVEKRLIIGSAVFGIGWGLLGVCPGPGIVNLVTLNVNAFIFVGSMLVGMIIFRFLDPVLIKHNM